MIYIAKSKGRKQKAFQTDDMEIRYYPGIQFRLPFTIFHGSQIVHWESLNAKHRCPK